MLKKCDTARCQTCHVTVILWFPVPSFFFLFFSLGLFPLFAFSNTPQQIWLIHLLTYEPFLNALVRGTTPCGNPATHNNVVDNMIQGLKYLLHLAFGKYLRSWIFNQYVHS